VREGRMGRWSWAAKAVRYGKPRSFAARCRLLWHDFITHGLLNRGEERCEDCGRGYVLWLAPDDLWLKAKGGTGGVLCPACFAERLERDGFRVMFEAKAWLRSQEGGG
jgi:hypothetical protein